MSTAARPIDSKELAIDWANEALQQLARIDVRPLKEAASGGVREWIERFLAANVPVNRLYWLPEGWRPPFLGCLQDEGAYAKDYGPLVAWVRVRNRSSSPLRIVERTVHHATKVLVSRGDGAAFVDGDTGITAEKIVMLAPGETVDLAAKWALNAWLQHSRDGWHPTYWGESSAIPQQDTLQQVGVWTTTNIDTRPREAERRPKLREGAVATG
jgi:hypothetical protein